MCKIGDIIGVPKSIGDGGNVIGFHYYIVISDKRGTIEGFDFDKVASVMSSFHSEEEKKKKLKHEENLEITTTNFKLNDKEEKEGYIKADQLHYFDKKKTKFFEVGRIDIELYNRLVSLIQYLDEKGKLKKNTRNLKVSNKEEQPV